MFRYVARILEVQLLEVLEHNLFDEPLHGILQVVTLDLQEDKPARFVELPQPDSVLGIDGGLPQGEDVVLGSGDVELKVLGLAGLDRGVLGSISGCDLGERANAKTEFVPFTCVNRTMTKFSSCERFST